MSVDRNYFHIRATPDWFFPLVMEAVQAEYARHATAPSPDPPSSRQVGGDHYTRQTVQPWNAMEAWMTREQFHGYLRGCAIKYLARCDAKGGVEDLRKARHYLDRLIQAHEDAVTLSKITQDAEQTGGER